MVSTILLKRKQNKLQKGKTKGLNNKIIFFYWIGICSQSPKLPALTEEALPPAVFLGNQNKIKLVNS